MATLDNVSIDIAVVLGKTSMPIRQVLRLGRGASIELDSSEEDEVRIPPEVKELLPRTSEAA